MMEKAKTKLEPNYSKFMDALLRNHADNWEYIKPHTPGEMIH